MPSVWALTAMASAAMASSLTSLCTTAKVKAALPADGFITGISIDSSSITTAIVSNSNVTNSNNYPNAVISYCNVTFAYSHASLNDNVIVQYWLPSNFSNRFLTTGGFGYAINSAASNLPEAIIYNAVGAATDGGFGSFSTEFDAVFPLANGTANLPALYAFSYEALHELTVLGKKFTRNIYAMSNSTKLHTYYHSCSEGGREGWSQVQRYGTQFDGVIVGAPAMRFSFQQLNHLLSNFVQQTIDYYPPTCELDKIINETIAACDPLDGKTDGVVSRSDLCKLDFNMTSLIGKSYYCAASSGGGSTQLRKRQFEVAAATPEQNGTITAKGVQLAQGIVNGLRDDSGNQVYLSYQPGSDLSQDGATVYNSNTKTWGPSISSFGGEFYQRFLKLVDSDTIESIAGLTYNDLRDWMVQGWYEYEDTLHTTNPDLTPFYNAGGKILHYHGEQDPSVPTASSVRYHESVRKIMYPGLSFKASTAKLAEWYKLYLVPGAAHCGPNTQEPNGPWCQTNLAVMINWVEKGQEPTTLNATYLAGDKLGQNAQICQWPLRPLWKNGNQECVYDQRSLNSWFYDFSKALKLPLY